MPSQARRSFDLFCRDIELLFSLDPIGPKGGKRIEKTEVLNKSVIVLLTAYWEAYCEDLATEAVEHLVEFSNEPAALPKRLRQQVAEDLKNAEHQLAIWELAGEGWRKLLRTRLAPFKEERNQLINTPNAKNIGDLFEKYVGIPGLTKHWTWQGMTDEQARRKLDQLVVLRGDIAHRGAAAKLVSRRAATGYLNHVKKLVGRTGGHVNSFLKKETGVGLWEPMLLRVVTHLSAKQMRAAIKSLTDAQRLVLGLRFGLQNVNLEKYDWDRPEELMTLEEIGKKLGMTRERIRQIEAEVIRKLRSFE